MRCPKCNADTRVKESRARGPCSIYRRRHCVNPDCGHSFTTWELLAEWTPDMETKTRYI